MLFRLLKKAGGFFQRKAAVCRARHAKAPHRQPEGALSDGQAAGEHGFTGYGACGRRKAVRQADSLLL